MGLASISLIIGIVAFFVTRKTNNNVKEGLNFKNIFSLLKDKTVIILVLMPTIFKRTDNACVSTIAHFIANLFGAVGIMFL